MRVLRSPLADKFIRTGKPVLTSGEIRPTDIVPVIAPNRNGKESAFPMKWGFNPPRGWLAVNVRVETAASKPVFRESWERRRLPYPRPGILNGGAFQIETVKSDRR